MSDKALFNRAALRRQALKVSKEVRLGKFTRVSEEFLDNVEAAVEAKFRSHLLPVSSASMTQVEPEGEKFLTGAGEAKLADVFNTWVAREIHRQVNNVRVGRTL